MTYKSKKSKIFFLKSSQIEFEFFFDSQLPYETRTSFLLPLVYKEQTVGSFFRAHFNFEILFLQKKSKFEYKLH